MKNIINVLHALRKVDADDPSTPNNLIDHLLAFASIKDQPNVIAYILDLYLIFSITTIMDDVKMLQARMDAVCNLVDPDEDTSTNNTNKGLN